MEKGAQVLLVMKEPKGREREFKIPATLGVRYLPRLPVPINKIDDDGPVSWTMLENRIGYIYVRKMDNSLIQSLDRAIKELSRAKGLIIDVRGNSGGGFDAQQACLNFDLSNTNNTERPRFEGPIALLTDARCISAGEGWASWFVANKRATVFGETTAGASSRKQTYLLKNGLYKVVIPVKAYTGFLDRPIEGRGLEPDIPVRQNAADLSEGKDTVLEAAKNWLLKKDSE
jgi:C-terminal processing protease CtpA/Prc